MKRIKVAPTYSAKWLETERPQPLSDTVIESLIQDVLGGKLDKEITDSVYTNFKSEMTSWLFSSKLNTFTGFDSYNRLDIVTGCTQYIDALYMSGPVQVIEGDYRYHARLGNQYTYPGILKEYVPLIVAMPFPNTGAVHTQMKELLDEAYEKEIPVHIDGAWITCCRDINFDVSHPSICSIGISLSKGLGLGWNRVGLRWIKKDTADAVTIQNDFNMNLRAPVMIGLHFLRNLEADYLWNTHGARYYQVCNDFDLVPTSSIYLALKDGQPVGVSPLIRYLHESA